MSKRLIAVFGVLLLALGIVLSACSSSSVKKEESTIEEVKPSEANEESLVRDTKVVTSKFGEVTIPTIAKNMIVTSSIYAEYLIEMGIIPQMVIVVPEVEPEYRKEYFEKHHVKVVEGAQYEYNFEQLLSFSPDLIVTVGQGLEQEVYDNLTKIAPTVVVDSNSEMEDAMKKLAIVFDKEVETEQILKDFNAKAELAKEKIHQALGDKTVLILRVEATRYRYMGSQGGDSSKFFYQTLGLNIPSILKESKDWFTPFSLEILPDINPDYIFLEQRILKDVDSSGSMKELQDSPIWKNLNAVKNNNVFLLSTNDFVHGVGPIGSVRLMDYVVGKLVP